MAQARMKLAPLPLEQEIVARVIALRDGDPKRYPIRQAMKTALNEYNVRNGWDLYFPRIGQLLSLRRTGRKDPSEELDRQGVRHMRAIQAN